MDAKKWIDGNFRGCAFIAKEGTNVLRQAYGYRDFVNEIPNTINTRFATASAGKAFVAVGILQLIEKRELSLHSTISEILPMNIKQIDPEITVKELLTHTSGIPDYFDESIMEEYDELWEDYPNYKIRKNVDIFPLFLDKPMQYRRGEKFQYNNTGYVVLAQIIEAVTHMPFDQYLQKNVFTPCKMDATGYYEMDRLPAGCANNYIWDEKKQQYYTNIYSVDAKGTGAGGAFTTVDDIARFWDNLLSFQLLSKEMTNSMLSIQSGNEEDGWYGYGVWLRREEDGSLSPYFQGSDPGVSFISMYQRVEKLLITLVSNYEDNVWKQLRVIREEIKKSLI